MEIDWRKFAESLPRENDWVLGCWTTPPDDPTGPRPVILTLRVFRVRDGSLWVDDDGSDDFYPITDAARTPSHWTPIPNAPEE